MVCTCFLPCHTTGCHTFGKNGAGVISHVSEILVNYCRRILLCDIVLNSIIFK